jgi:5'-nucleotidase
MCSRRTALFVIAATAVALYATPSLALDILLTNDDSYTSVGILTMRAALKSAGHDVTVVAPFGERSGSSAAVNFAPVSFHHLGGQFWVLFALEKLITGERVPLPATPATCVLFGLTVTLDGVAPDLIVSGTNVGANVGTATSFSGTVGAATAALSANVPAIAFSSDPPEVPEDDPEFAAHYEDVAAFAVDLIDHLESKPGALSAEPGLLPKGLALNVNYPTVAPEAVQGVMLTAQGQALSTSLAFVPVGGGVYVPVSGPTSSGDIDVKDSDTQALAAGYITVTPMNSDMTAPPRNRARFESAIASLND